MPKRAPNGALFAEIQYLEEKEKRLMKQIFAAGLALMILTTAAHAQRKVSPSLSLNYTFGFDAPNPYLTEQRAWNDFQFRHGQGPHQSGAPGSSTTTVMGDVNSFTFYQGPTSITSSQSTQGVNINQVDTRITGNNNSVTPTTTQAAGDTKQNATLKGNATSLRDGTATSADQTVGGVQ